MLGSIEQYLERYAEPEARVGGALDRSFRRVLAVPVCNEAAGLLGGLEAALGAEPGTALCIVVVNAPLDAKEEVHRQNAALFGDLQARLRAPRRMSLEPPIWFGEMGSYSLLLVDRQSAEHRLPLKQGVGLARRIASDIALAMVRAGHLTGRFIATTDADVELPADYFSVIEAVPEAQVAAVYPFEHIPSGNQAVDRATALYEIWLRYYVLGLRSAGSPYAMHTIGSTLAVRADAYASVRGFPKRNAAEDFYLLNKLAKVGPVAQLRGTPLRIRSRLSERVPFGTGQAVTAIRARLGAANELALYHPATFEALRAILTCLQHFALHRDWNRALLAFDPVPAARPSLLRLLETMEIRQAALAAAEQAKTPPQLARRLHVWFDAFKTLKAMHLLRDEAFAMLPWQTALREAPFVGDIPEGVLAEPATARAQLAAHELWTLSSVCDS